MSYSVTIAVSDEETDIEEEFYSSGYEGYDYNEIVLELVEKLEARLITTS